MSNRIIFLDVDGVLIPYGWESVKRFKPSCIEVFKEIVRITDAHIVISSSWRLGEMTRLENLLRMEGLWERVIGTTTCDVIRGPKQFRENGEEIAVLYNDCVSRSRPAEIKLWLEEHPEITAYIVIDDEEMNGSGLPRITPECHTGLEPHHVVYARVLFGV